MTTRNVPGPKILLLGGTGTGKTYSIRTLVASGLETLVLFTEPGMETISDISCEKGLHWHYIPPASAGWDVLLSGAQKINQLSFEALAKLTDLNKTKFTEMLDILSSCAKFKCDRCGKEFGSIDILDSAKYAVVVDSLSGLSIAAMNLVAGTKPVKSMPDWGIAMDTIERFVIKLTTDVRCTTVMIGHLEREADEMTGGIQLMASTLGRKLAPKLPRFFSDVIMSRRTGDKFEWSTAAMNTDLKTRNLPINDHLPPDFGQIVKKWREHNS
jgi:hypothetical protein